MYRLADREINLETAEMDVVATHTGAGRHDRGHGLEGVHLADNTAELLAEGIVPPTGGHRQHHQQQPPPPRSHRGGPGGPSTLTPGGGLAVEMSALSSATTASSEADYSSSSATASDEEAGGRGAVEEEGKTLMRGKAGSLDDEVEYEDEEALDGGAGEGEEGAAALGRGRRQRRTKARGRGHKQSFEVELASMDPALRARLTNMWALPNLALLLSYFTIGFAMTFTGTPLTVYIVSDLGVGPAQLNICGTMLALPWSFKVLYGLLSDCVPIRGKRRKPYFLIGWALFVLANLTLACLGRPSLNAVISLGFFSVCGYMLADVMCDAIIVERSKLEPEGKVGTMQAVGYVARYVGNVVGATLGTVLYNKAQWHWGLSISQIFLLNALVAAGCVFPFAYHLDDPNKVEGLRTLREQLGDIWHMVQRRTIYRPMAFIAIYNMLMIPNAAWSNFLILGLKFTPWMLGIMFMVATVFSWLGITFYRTFLMQRSWRWVYIVSTSLSMLFSVLQLCLIFRVNERLGLSDLAFALGDDAIANFVSAMQFLPTVTMYIGLCPAGAEGTSYAMLTTLSNVAGTIGSDVGTLLTSVWDVGNTALESGEWSGLWKLSLLTSLIQPLGLGLLFLLPRDVAHQKAMQKCDRRSFWGGLAFVGFLVVAWSWTVIQTLTYMFKGK